MVHIVEAYFSYKKRGAQNADYLKAPDFAGFAKLQADCVLGLGTGSSPVGTYRELIGKFERGELDFSQVKTVNLDEAALSLVKDLL